MDKSKQKMLVCIVLHLFLLVTTLTVAQDAIYEEDISSFDDEVKNDLSDKIPEISQEDAFLSDTERAALLEEAVRETDEQSYSMAKTFQTARSQYSSALLTSANKRPSRQAATEGRARVTFENIINNFENKVIAGRLSKITNPQLKTSLKCIHHLGDFIKPSELRKTVEKSHCQLPQINCPVQIPVPEFRTIDGSCNNRECPRQGMADAAFRRLLPAFYEDGIEVPKGRLQAVGCLKNFCLGPFDPPVPSAREVSRQIVLDDLKNTEAPFTHMVMQWGQFLDHDLGLAPELEHEGPCKTCALEDDCEPIRIADNDPVFGGGKGTTEDGKCLHFRRSAAECTTTATLSPRQQINDLTSYLDGSQIYGSNATLAERLRNPKDSSLMDTSIFKGRIYLPTSTEEEDCRPMKKCFLAGDVRANEQVGLTTLHTLFVREHNRIAKQLKQLNGKVWNAERVYQEARKIVGAMLQKITYDDYLAIVIGKFAYDTVIPPHSGYKKCADATIPNSFAAAAYRYGHSLVRPVFERFTSDQYEKGLSKPINLRKSFFNMDAFVETDIDAVLRGLVTQSALRNDEFMNTVMTTQLFERDNSRGMDLASLNIQRGRDHGLPMYGAWISYCKNLFKKLPAPEIARQLTLWRIYGVYGSQETVDLFVGGMAEKKLPGSLLSPTFACLFGIAFTDLRDGDRFFYEHKGVFTSLQLKEIKKATLSRIICDNTKIGLIQPNAFRNDQARVRCNTLPSVDLQKWLEITPRNQEIEETFEDGVVETPGEEAEEVVFE